MCVFVRVRGSYFEGVRMSDLLCESVDSVVSSVDPQSWHHSYKFLVPAGVIPEDTGQNLRLPGATVTNVSVRTVTSGGGWSEQP